VRCRRALALVVAFLAAAPAARAGVAARSPGDAGQQRFVRRYMAAVAARDVQAIVRLTHPASRACMDETTREFFDVVLAREADHVLTAGFTIVSIAPVPPGAPVGTSPDLFRYPVLPTHEFQVEFRRGGPTSTTTLVRQIAPLDGAWYTVLVCPTREGLARFRERQVEARRRIDAVRRYREASGTDLTTAVGVIDVLSGRRSP
jgi:hypothetical protein